MALTDKQVPQGKSSATLGLAGGKLCFIRDTSAVSEATGSAESAPARAEKMTTRTENNSRVTRNLRTRRTAAPGKKKLAASPQRKQAKLPLPSNHPEASCFGSAEEHSAGSAKPRREAKVDSNGFEAGEGVACSLGKRSIISRETDRTGDDCSGGDTYGMSLVNKERDDGHKEGGGAAAAKETTKAVGVEAVGASCSDLVMHNRCHAGGALSTRRSTGVSKGKAGNAKGKFRGKGIFSASKLVSDDVGDIELGVLGGKVELAPGEDLATKGAAVGEIEVMEVEDDDEVTAIEVRPGASGTDENVSVIRATGGLTKGITDDKLLSTVDMFLTKEQRLQKRAQKVLMERAKRDAWAKNSNIGATGDDQREGNSSAKRPRVMASIFGKPTRGATSGGRKIVNQGKWVDMPAPFPTCRHVTAMPPMQVDDNREGCNGVDGEGMQLLSDVVPGGLPPLPLIVSALESSCDRRSEASEREAEAWRDAATLARRDRRPKIDSGNDVTTTEWGSLLPSPTAILFAGPGEGLERTGLEDDVERDCLEEDNWNGEMTVISRSQKERIMKIAAGKRIENAAADTMWTELYRPKSPDEVCGNAHVVDALSRWLGEWKERRGRPGDNKKRSPSTGGNSDDSEYEWVRFDDEDDKGESRLCNMTMICGPTGVGKTSTVYGCANALGYEVIEVNPSQLRSGSAIRRLFGEATQSHNVSSAESKPPRGGVDAISERGSAGFFSAGRGGCGVSAKGKGRRKGKVSRGKNPGGRQGRKRPLVDEGSETVKVVTSAKLTLILFDEVDVVFEEDVGFLGALRDLRRMAKCPVILTAESYRREFAQLSCDILYMPRPRLAELEVCLMAVAAAEGLDVSSSALRSLAQFHLGDLRACLLTLQACKGRRNRCQHAEEGTPFEIVCEENSKERSKVKGRSMASNRRRRSRLGKGAPSAKLPEESFKEGSDERFSVPCWRRLASHVEADNAMAHHLAFDTFLPALAEGFSLVTAASKSTSSGDGREGLEAVAVLGGDKSGDIVGPIPGFLGSGLTHEVLWEPPFLNRWPEVLAVSPSSAPAETCPISSKSAPLFGREGKRAVSREGIGSPWGTSGHRVLITGRYFAHPVGVKNSLQEPSHLEEGMPIKGRECQTAEKSSRCGMREVFVRFGEVEVRGKVLSDSLVEAYAPPRYRPGFVEVSVAVKGGIGGDIVSNASVSKARSCKRFSVVLFRYCAPPPPFPPIVGVKTGMRGGGFKAKGGGKRRKTAKTATSEKDGSENVLNNVSKSGPDNGAVSPLVVNGRYGPILLENEDDERRASNGDGDRRGDEMVTFSSTKISKRGRKRRFVVIDDEERIVDEKQYGTIAPPRDIDGGFNACETEHDSGSVEKKHVGTAVETEHGSVHVEKEHIETAVETEHGMLGAVTATASGDCKMEMNQRDSMSTVDGHVKENTPSTAGPTSEGVLLGAGETASITLEPYDIPTPAQADSQRALGVLLKATSALADAFSAADAIGGVSLARGWDGAASPLAEGGEEFLTIGGSSWAEQDPRVSQGFLVDEANAGLCMIADGLPRTLWDGARDWYQSVCRRKGDESTRYFLSRPSEVTTHKSPEILEHRSPEKPMIADSAAGPKDSNVQTMGLRGCCLAYCQRDRADFISSGSALATRPLRARGSTTLPDALTLDLAPVLSQLCAIEENRQAESGIVGVGGRRGGRFRHYLVRTGVVGNYREAERIARIYKEPAW